MKTTSKNAIMQVVNELMSIWLRIGGKMILLLRLFCRYRGNFPAAPVESAPMLGLYYFLFISMT